jgi:hypothetical protein
MKVLWQSKKINLLVHLLFNFEIIFKWYYKFLVVFLKIYFKNYYVLEMTIIIILNCSWKFY